MAESIGDSMLRMREARDAASAANAAAIQRLREFETARARYDSLCEAQAAASRLFDAIPGIGSGRMGLTPDAIKFAAPYREARAAYDKATAELRAFVPGYLKRFKREITAERNAKRGALIAAFQAREAQAAGQ